MIHKIHLNYVFIFSCMNILIVLAQKQNQYYNNQQQYSYNTKNLYDSRYFKHGNQRNELVGGTCAEFIQMNSLDQCCTQRDDDCYMIHFDTRCYCDVFCDRSKIPDNSDCCPDAGSVCNGVYAQQIATTRLQIIG
jgi:hypothetical protein